jgi:predicted amidohydrolase YtcJ
VTRIVGDSIFYGENTIDLHNCIKAYTTNNAYASFNEGTRGSISEGKCADFMIMDDDLFQLPTNKIQNAKVLKTYFDGQEVYSYKDL